MRRVFVWKNRPPEEMALEREKMAEARRRLERMAESGIGISCGGCGHFDDASKFTTTAVFGELPPGQFQCPKCGWAVERRSGKPTVYESGFVAPGPVTLARIGARL